MVFLLEKQFPKNYYINMLPLLADIKLLRYILWSKNERFINLLKENDVDLNFLLTPWFLLIFVEIKNFELQNIIFDFFICEGIVSYFKICLVLFD